jgi:hypothetical protein
LGFDCEGQRAEIRDPRAGGVRTALPETGLPSGQFANRSRFRTETFSRLASMTSAMASFHSFAAASLSEGKACE